MLAVTPFRRDGVDVDVLFLCKYFLLKISLKVWIVVETDRIRHYIRTRADYQEHKIQPAEI